MRAIGTVGALAKSITADLNEFLTWISVNNYIKTNKNLAHMIYSSLS